MFSLNYVEVEVVDDVEAILIPDGVPFELKKGQKVQIQQVLGGMFTVQSDTGHLLRVDGLYAESIGQPVPDDRRVITVEDVAKKTLYACVMEQLRTCYDPEIPVNVVDLGLIYACEIKEITPDHFAIRIEMTLTAPLCGMGEVLKSDVTKKLKDIPSIDDVLVDLVFDPAWDSSMMSESAKLSLGFM